MSEGAGGILEAAAAVKLAAADHWAAQLHPESEEGGVWRLHHGRIPAVQLLWDSLVEPAVGELRQRRRGERG